MGALEELLAGPEKAKAAIPVQALTSAECRQRSSMRRVEQDLDRGLSLTV